jgi:pantothenate kinase type III
MGRSHLLTLQLDFGNSRAVHGLASAAAIVAVALFRMASHHRMDQLTFLYRLSHIQCDQIVTMQVAIHLSHQPIIIAKHDRYVYFGVAEHQRIVTDHRPGLAESPSW